MGMKLTRQIPIGRIRARAGDQSHVFEPRDARSVYFEQMITHDGIRMESPELSATLQPA
jgi:hypothetical protein